MASEAAKVPIIDFSQEDFKPGTPTWKSVKVEVGKALEGFGCFIVLYDEIIPMEIRKAVFESSEDLLDLSIEAKTKYGSSTDFQSYYCSPGYECIVVDKLKLPETIESFRNMMWPQGNSKFSETILFYLEKLPELGKIVRRMVLENLGLEKYMDEHMDSTDFLLQFSKFTGPQSSEKTLAVRAHSDKGLLGIITQNETNGLEISTKDGQWIGVDFPPNSFLVLPGDIYHAWTNGRLHAPVHRVIMTGNDTRYSVALYAKPKPGYIVKAPEEIVDQQHPRLYKPFDATEFLDFYYTKAGQSSEFPLKEYCGV